MKNSAIQDPEWYPLYPEDWKLGRVKTAIESFDSGVWGEDPYDDDTSTPVIRSNELDEGGNWRVTTPALRLLSSSEREQARLREGDLLIVKSSGSHAHIGKSAVVTKEIEDLGSCFSNFTGRIRVLPCRANSRFLWYFLNNSPGRDQLFYYGTTTTGLINLSAKSIGVGIFALPPLQEQLRVVAYLDASCAAIDAAVAAKRGQLETLDALSLAVIHQAVTRGINVTVKLRPSGMDWLSEVPEHWQVQQIKRTCEIVRGKFTHRPRNDPAFYDGEYPFVQTGDITAAQKYIRTYSQTLNDLGLSVSKTFPRGTLVMSIAANIGDVAILDFEACFPDSMVGLIPRHKTDLNFLYYMMRAMKGIMLRSAVISTQLNLNNVRIGNNFAAFPPVKEQKVIGEYLDAKEQESLAVKETLNKQIATLTAYRKSLIHECVTGQRRITEADVQRAQNKRSPT
ncbi:MAG: restriction endonuclease subunit S [Deltaproteobacteria bacterium]|nr:restriction endonuclease subunit S [Deltaproteobacteria bacterium]